MDQKIYEKMLDTIETHNIYFLFGFFQDCIMYGLMNKPLSEMTEAQAVAVTDALWQKLKKREVKKE